jgi:hypothetical protein
MHAGGWQQLAGSSTHCTTLTGRSLVPWFVSCRASRRLSDTRDDAETARQLFKSPKCSHYCATSLACSSAPCQSCASNIDSIEAGESASAVQPSGRAGRG